MKKTALLSALAAAALLAGCRTTQANHARRGAFAGGQSVSASQPPNSRVRDAAKTRPVAQPAPGTVSETPLVPERTQPVAERTQPVAVQARSVANTAPAVPMWTTSSAAAKPAPAPVAAPVAPTPAATGFETYVVKSGDVAGRIANSHGMTLKEFREANGMTLEEAGKLRVGQKVKVWAGGSPLADGPSASPTQPAASGDSDVYVVQPGDTLGRISAKTGVSVATLMANNGIDDPNMIRAGRTLVLKKQSGSAPVKPIVEPVQPVKPVESVQPVKPVAEPVQPVKPIAEPVQPVKPVKQTAKPVEPGKPVESVAKPVESVKPVSEPVKQTAKPVKQSVKTAKQTAKPVEPAAEPVQPAAEPAPPPQDASVPLDEVKVAGTDLSVADILDGASLSDAREQAETKKDDVSRQVENALRGASDAAPEGYKYYVVKEGETLYHLGARYKVPFKTLRELNNLPPGASKLEAGTRLLVPDTASPAP